MPKKNKKSKQDLRDQAQDEFLTHVSMLVRYWEAVPDQSVKEKLSGLAFSIMAALDGCAMGLPGHSVIPDNADVDLSGDLHERWYWRHDGTARYI